MPYPLMTEELSRSFSRPAFIATWPFGKAACQAALQTLLQTESMRDAVELGIHTAESDESVTSVGYGGRPNAAGVMQFDASFMDGERQQAGSVAAIEGVRHPISVARRVMEATPHAMLVGADAAKFAQQQGFPTEDLLSPAAKASWLRWQAKQQTGDDEQEKTHDTIALLGVADSGHLVGGCSTSGMAYKLPGRVGDSPLIGSGLYVDGAVGAAGATGIGENVMRYCGSFLIVEFMRQGMTPLAACIATIRRIAEGERKAPAALSVNFVAMNKAGHLAAAGTDTDFLCGIADQSRSLVVQPYLVD